MWCTYNCTSSVTIANQFGWSKRYQPKIALIIHNEVVWLQISNHYFLAHEVLEKEDHVSGIELSVCGAQKAYLADRVIERFTLDELGYLKNVLFSFYEFVESWEKGVLSHLWDCHFLTNNVEGVGLF